MKPLLTIIIILFSGCGAIPDLPSRSTDAKLQAGVRSPPKALTITVLDVGEGDATLISTPGGHHLLIDAGPPGSGKRVTLPYLKEIGIAEFDHIVMSHYDSDHIGGLAEILAGTDGLSGTKDDIIVRGRCWDRGDITDKDTAVFKTYASATTACAQEARAGDQITLDDSVTIEVMAVNGVTKQGALAPISPDDENAASMVLRISYQNFSYLTTGDLPGGGGNPPFVTIDEETPLAAQVGHVDVLHLGHHGSHTASNMTFLKALSPAAAIISVGDGNDYHHPHPSVLQRLSDLQIPVYQTERGHDDGTMHSHVMDGHIIIESDGTGFEINANES